MGTVLQFRRRVERIGRQVEDSLGVSLEDYAALTALRSDVPARTSIWCTNCAEALCVSDPCCPQCGAPNPART